MLCNVMLYHILYGFILCYVYRIIYNIYKSIIRIEMKNFEMQKFSASGFLFKIVIKN